MSRAAPRHLFNAARGASGRTRDRFDGRRRETCAYCGSRVSDHDPIRVRDRDDGCGSPTCFCNYACLSAYADEQDLSAGNACEWSPGE